MKFPRVIASAIIASAACFNANATVPVDSVNNAVAVFIASNISLAIDNALANIVSMGVPVDTAAVKELVAVQMFKKHSDADRKAALATIENAVNAAMTQANEQLLATARAAKNAIVLPSGVVLETILEGKGAIPTVDEKVALRYIGRLPDGSTFDSITPDQEPMRVRPTELVKGMTEGILNMHRGGEYRITIPGEAAYGANGIPGVIPPNCVLQFDVSLLDE